MTTSNKEQEEKIAMCTSNEKLISPSNKGYPGHLTKSEFQAFLQLKEEVDKRPESFRDTIFSFGYEEEEAYALCRWLSMKRFSCKRTVTMIEEAVKFREEAVEMNFYPDATDALGVEVTVYKALFPEFFIGHSKEGIPVYYSQMGIAEFKMLFSTIATEGFLRHHWHLMHHGFGERFRERKSKDKNFQRFEAFIIIDLKDFSVVEAMHFLHILKEQTIIDENGFAQSICRCIIINAPSAFSVLWNLIKGFLNPQLTERVGIFSSKKDIWQKRLLELIDESELPEDYGGTGPSMEEVYKKATKDPDVKEQFVQPITTNASHRKGGSIVYQIKLDTNEVLELTAFTKSNRTATICVLEKKEDGNMMKHMTDIVHKGGKKESDKPTRITVLDCLHGPGEFDIILSCERKQENIVLLGKVR